MNWFNYILRRIFIIFLVAVVLGVGSLYAAYQFFSTEAGTRWLIGKFLAGYAPAAEYTIGRVEGNIWGQLSLFDVDIRDFQGWPASYAVKIRKIDVYFAELDPASLNIEFHHGRLHLPVSDPMVIDGIYQEGSLDVDIYVKHADIQEVLDLGARNMFPRDIHGTISDGMCSLKGPLSDLTIRGRLTVDRVSHERAQASGVIEFDVDYQTTQSERTAYGAVFIKAGLLELPRSRVTILPGKISFEGDPNQPHYALRGRADVAGTKINVFIEGAGARPVMKLASDPPMPEDRLLVMLATGQAWAGTEEALSQGRVSTDMAKDFLDYFLLGGAGSRWIESLGISDVTFNYDEKQRNLKLGAAVKLTQGLSVGAKTELRGSQASVGAVTETAPFDQEVFFKYRKRF